MLSLLSCPISTNFGKMYIIYQSLINSTLSFYVTEKACVHAQAENLQT